MFPRQHTSFDFHLNGSIDFILKQVNFDKTAKIQLYVLAIS